MLWRPERAISDTVATWANTSSSQWRCGHSNLGKILIKFVIANVGPGVESLRRQKTERFFPYG
jgi:hypothetical protein